jgi:nucleotide-binding universal stress UspA family protein
MTDGRTRPPYETKVGIQQVCAVRRALGLRGHEGTFSFPVMRPLRRILLATDLSARSDRALDRAARLALDNQADLVVLHVLEATEEMRRAPRASVWAPFDGGGAEWPEINPRLVNLARRQLSAQLKDVADRAQIRIEAGDPAELILRLAKEPSTDLVVTGVARNEFLGRFTLGKTVERVLRETVVPLLIVNEPALSAYRAVAIAVDFSESSRKALQHALALFPGKRFLVFHGYDLPYGSFVRDHLPEGSAQIEAMAKTRKFLDEVVAAEERTRLDVIVEEGDPATRLRELSRQGALELVVLGSNPRGALVNALLGNVAQRIVAALPCDALVVSLER